MIINFDLTPMELENQDRAILLSAVGELVRAHMRGHHILVIPRDTGDWLSDKLDLGEHSLGGLRRIMTERPQFLGLVSESTFVLHVKSDRRENIPGAREFFSTCSDIHEFNLSSPVVMCVEDAASDGEFYRLLLNGRRRRLRAQLQYIELSHGGGDGIDRGLRALIDQRRLVVCVVDSDKAAPSATGSEKVARLLRVADECGWPYVKVFETPCREVENFNPVEVLLNLQSCPSENCKESIINISDKDVGYMQTDAFLTYFDVKNGINPNIYSKLSGDSKMWYREKLGIIGKDPRFFSIGGFGDRVISQILNESGKRGELVKAINSKVLPEGFQDFLLELSDPFAAAGRSFT